MSKILLVAGVLLVLYGVTADMLGLSGPGYGPKQILTIMVGFVLFAAGLGRGRYADWHQLNQSHPALSMRQLLVFACWLGLLAGFAETLALCARHWLFGYGLSFNQHHLWMKPLVNLVLFGGVGLALSLASVWIPSLGSTAAATLLLVFLGTTGALLQVPELDLLAKLMLAAGCSLAASRASAARLEQLRSTAQRTVPWAVAAAAALCLCVWVWRRLPEPPPLAQSTGVAGKPNVVFIVLDTVRARNLSLYGYDRPTSPRLDEFATKSVVFEQAFSTAPWTLSSHATMFSGAPCSRALRRR